MRFEIHPSVEEGSRQVAVRIRDLIQAGAAEGRNVVLGLATGSSPLSLYAELVRMHREEGLSFKNVITFNLDEYLGLGRDHPRSYWRFMHEQLFDHVDLPGEQIHIPGGDLQADEVSDFCRGYEEAIRSAGGIDLQILGIGRTGHIGFNEPGAGRNSRTMRVTLDPLTRQDAAGGFGGLAHVPKEAITMGCATILNAREIALLAWGESKAEIVAEAFEGEVKDEVPASYLQEHASVTIHLDEGAGKLLTALKPEDSLARC